MSEVPPASIEDFLPDIEIPCNDPSHVREINADQDAIIGAMERYIEIMNTSQSMREVQEQLEYVRSLIKSYREHQPLTINNLKLNIEPSFDVIGDWIKWKVNFNYNYVNGLRITSINEV